MNRIPQQSTSDAATGGLRDTLGDVARLLRTGWFRFAVLTGILVLAALVVFSAEALALFTYFEARAAQLVADGVVTLVGAKEMATVSTASTAVVFAIVGTVVAATSVGAADRIYATGSSTNRAALGRAVRRLPALLGASVLGVLGIVALLVATPFIVNAAILGLILTPIARRVRRRRPGLSWPSVRTMLIAVVPFGLAARQALRWTLLLPAGLDGAGGPRQILARSTRAVRGRVGTIVTSLLVALGAIAVAQGVMFALSSLSSNGGVRGLAFLVGLAAGGWVLAATLAVLYRGQPSGGLAIAGAGDAPVEPSSPADEIPLPSGLQTRGLAMAMLIIAAFVLTPTLRVAPAAAASGGGGTFVVNDLGSATDANPGDGTCATTTGTCTLAAAIVEGNAATPGSSSDVTFAVSGTIAVPSTLVVQRGISIDATDQKVVLDGGGTTQIMFFSGEGGAWTLRHLTLANGHASDPYARGAAVQSNGNGTIDGVTFADNVNAQGSGGAVAGYGTVTVTNSTFVNNKAPGGGADLWSGGTMSVTNSTFVGSAGGPIDLTFMGTIDNSIIAGAAGAFGCTSDPNSGGTVTGTNNLGNDASCPGSTVNTAMGLGPLADNGGDVPTISLASDSPAIDSGDSATCTASDVRGIARPQLATCDIGAVEFDPATATVVAATPAVSMPGDMVQITASVTRVHETGGVTGTVTFLDGATVLGSAPLDGADIATLSVDTLAIGSHTITADYGGAFHTSPASGTTSHRVSPGSLSVSLTSSQSPSLVGDAVMLSATLYLPGTLPATGTVTFTDGTTTLGTATISGSAASLTTSALVLGKHDIVGTYGGDANYDPATSTALSQVVQAHVTIAPTASPSPVLYGIPVTITAHLSSPDTTAIPTGSVIVESGTVVTTATVDASGDISFTTSALPAGTDTVLIAYQGDTTFQYTSTTVDVQVNNASTATTLLVTPVGPTALGAVVTLAAHVTASGTPATPGGAVELFDGTTSLGLAALDVTGSATFTTTALGLGGRQLTATFRPGPGFSASTSSPVGHTVTAVSTTMALHADAATTLRGQAVSFEATVAAVDSAAVPSGPVSFDVDGVQVGTATLDAAGVATLTVTSMTVGDHDVTATYLGTSDFTGSTSSVVAHHVDKASATVVVGASPAVGSHGQFVSFTATVTATAPGATDANGAVTFTDGTRELGTTTLDTNGVATLDVRMLGAGEHTVTATYAGDADLVGGSGTVSVTVDPVSSTMLVTTAPPSVDFGSTVTITATVTTATGVAAVGSVNIFDDDSSFFASVPLDANGVATLEVDTLSVGTHHLRINFSSADVELSTATTSVTVNKATPTVTTTVSSDAIQVGDPVTITATVAGSAVATPSGQVQFLVDGTVVDTEYLTISSAGIATASLGMVLSAGSHSIRVIYQGNTSYALTASTATPVAVGRHAANLTGSFGTNTLYTGQQATLIATVATIPGRAAPTGTVTFSLDGTLLGAVSLGIVDAVVTSPALSAGAHTLVVAYSGDGVYAPTSTTTTTTVLPPPTVTSISASTANPKVGQVVTYTVTVNNIAGTLPVVGYVSLRVDGVAQGFAATLGTGPSGQVHIDVAISDAGPHSVTADFVPADGSISASVGQLAETVTRYATSLDLVVSTTVPSVGGWVTVGVTATSTDPAGPPPIALNGIITVSDGNGSSCLIVAPSGTCRIRWDAIGTRKLTATLPVSMVFEAATSAPVVVSVVPATPMIRAASSTDRWVVGDPVDVAWGVDGPTTGTVTVTTTGGHTWCTVAVSAGSCTGTFLPGERTIGSVTVHFDGTADWLAASTTVVQPVLGCVRVNVGTTDRGSVDVSPAPNCNNGTGYVSLTVLQLTAHPAPGLQFEGFTDPRIVTSGTNGTFAVDASGTGDVVRLNARFGYACNSLLIAISGPVGVGGLGSPECTNQAGFDSAGHLITWWRTGTDAAVTLIGLNWYEGPDGTRVTSTTSAVAYRLDGAPAGTPLNLSFYQLEIPIAQDAQLDLRFGRACYTLATGVSGGGGTAAADTAGTCRNPFGDVGYVPGTQVHVHFAEAARSVFDHWNGSPWPLTDWATSATDATFTITGDTSLTAQVHSCHQLTVGNVGFPEDGTVAAVTPSNCGNDAGWYLDGTDVRVNWASWYFKGWADDQPDANAYSTDPHSGASWFRLDVDRSATAIFRNDAMCPSLTVNTMPASGAGTARAQGPNLHSDYPCSAGTYPTVTALDRVPSACFARYVAQTAQTRDRALLEVFVSDYESCSRSTPDYVPGKTVRRVHQQWVDFEATPAAGKPLMGWSYTTSSPPWADDVARGAYSVDDLVRPRTDTGSVGATNSVDIYGETTATAWFCETLTGQAELVHPDGSKSYEPATLGSDYIAVSPAPNCPIAPNAWVVGTTVRVAPAAAKAGYTFNHWYSGASGTDSTTEIILDGSQPNLKVGVSYALVCHQLTVQGSDPVEVNPKANCTGAGDGNWYIGGTLVGLNAVDRGSDYKWGGWHGDVGTSDNPSWVVMNADKSVVPDWSEKNIAEKAIDWFVGAYHSVSNFMTHDVADYFSNMKDASIVVMAVVCKGAQMAFQAFFSPTFGLLGLPLNVLRLLNLALDNDSLTSVINNWTNVMSSMDISNLLLGCAADSVLGLNQGPNDLTAEDAKALGSIASTAKNAYTINQTGSSSVITDPAFGKATQAGVVFEGAYTGYEIGTSIAAGNIATHGQELSDRYESCIYNLVPKGLAGNVAGAVG